MAISDICSQVGKEILDCTSIYTEEYDCSMETLSEMEEGEI